MASQRAPELFNFTYGLFNWFLFAFLAIWSGSFFHRSSEKERNELSLGTVIYFSPPASVLSREQADQDLLERDKLWNLTKSWSGFKHYFLNLRDGIKIHYVTNEEPDSNSAKTKPLFIFIHGFPDSWALWRHLLHSELRHLGILVALDLPGYGGSDSLTNYGATEVFEALAQFILDIREKYGFDADDRGNGERKVYIVGHDWGCALGCRLACEAPDLADRFILSNAPMPQLLIDNAERMSSSAAKMFKMFLHHPISSRPLLRKSISAVSPLLRQMKRSGYAFAFQLPNPFIRMLGTGGNYSFLRYIHQSAAGKIGHFSSRDAAESMASTIGPSPLECKTITDSKGTYPESVLKRSKHSGEFFVQQTGLYRGGAFFEPWTKSLDTIAGLHNLGASDMRRRSSSGAGLFDDGQKKTLKQRATFVWGQKDSALVESVAFYGIGDYLPKGSQVVLLPRTGHFTPIEKESRLAFEKVLEWVVGGEKGDLEQAVGEVYHGAIVSVNK